MAKPPSAKKKASREDQPEGRPVAPHHIVIVAGDDNQNAGAEAEQAACLAPSHQLREVGEGEAADEADTR